MCKLSTVDCYAFPDSKVHGANLGPIWGRQDPGGPLLSHELCYLGLPSSTKNMLQVSQTLGVGIAC